MRKVWLVVVLAVTVIAFGCGGGGSAKSVAVKILEAGKTGDADVLLDHMDLKGMYEEAVPEEAREQMPYEEFEKMTRKAMEEGVDLNDVPQEERLGPGGLDPVEVFESLPASMQEAFESRNTDQLKKALMEMSPKEAEVHLKRCVDSGLWNEEA